MTRGLTKRQALVLECIKTFQTDNGYSPSLKEIGDMVGLKAPSHVSQIVSALEHKGYVKRAGPHMARAIKVL